MSRPASSRSLSSRLSQLEAALIPNSPSRTFVLFVDGGAAEERFMAENAITEHDHLVVVTFLEAPTDGCFDADEGAAEAREPPAANSGASHRLQ